MQDNILIVNSQALVIRIQRKRDAEFPPPDVDFWLDSDGAFVIDSDGVEIES